MAEGQAGVEEVPPGYKRTKVGVIPEDWDVQTLSEIGQCLIGLTYSPENVTSDGLLVLRASNIGNNGLQFEDNVFVEMEVPEKLIVLNGDLLICARSGSRSLIGKCALIDKYAVGMTFGAFMSIFRSPDNRFVLYCFQSEIVKKQIHEHLGATINQITNKSLKSFLIPCPTLEERGAIATVLSDADGLIKALDALIEKKRAFMQAAMQQLLTGKKRLPGFEGEWETKRLGELTTSKSGGTPPTSISRFYNGGIPWISITDMTGVGKWISITDRTLSQEGLDRINVQLWPPKTVFYAMYASIGECCIGSVELSSSQAILGIQTKSSLDSEYLYYHLVFRKDDARKMAQRGTQANLNAEIVRNFQIPLPTIQEQHAIATVLSDMDAEITALERRRDKAEQIKQAMMQELLTGRTRLIDPPEVPA